MPPLPVRRVSATSRRFHAAPRSKPVAWLIGGIGGCFAIALTFVLLGGAPPVDTLPEAVAAIEAKARLAEDAGRLEEAIAHFQELLRITLGREDFRVSAIEWRRVIKDLQAEIVRLKRVDDAFAALEKRAASDAPGDLRALWEEVQRFEIETARLKRPWASRLTRLSAELRSRLPKPPPSWMEMRQSIVGECRLDRRGEALWGLAIRRWKEYLKLNLDVQDVRGAEDAMRAVELRAREEVASLRGRRVSTDELRQQRPRFEGTAALAELDVLMR